MSVKYLKYIFILLGFHLPDLQAQVTISANTPMPIGDAVRIVIQTTGDLKVNQEQTLKNTTLILNGSNQNLTLSGPLTLETLQIDNGTQINLSGSGLTVRENILFNNGIFNPQGNKLLFTGSQILSGNDNSYVKGSLSQLGTGVRSFPIGSADGIYAPFALEGVSDEGVELSVEAFHGNPNVSNIPIDVPDYSQNWYWELSQPGGFSGAIVTLPIQTEDASLFSSGSVAGVVLQADATRNSITNLRGSIGTESVKSLDLGTGPVFFLGTQLNVEVVVHNIISPNGDGFNDYLVVENLGLLGINNKVTLVDRWGVVVYEKEGFENFDQITNPYDGSFDFLEPGNYVCILQVPGRETVTQTITVVRN